MKPISKSSIISIILFTVAIVIIIASVFGYEVGKDIAFKENVRQEMRNE